MPYCLKCEKTYEGILCGCSLYSPLTFQDNNWKIPIIPEGKFNIIKERKEERVKCYTCFGEGRQPTHHPGFMTCYRCGGKGWHLM